MKYILDYQKYNISDFKIGDYIKLEKETKYTKIYKLDIGDICKIVNIVDDNLEIDPIDDKQGYSVWTNCINVRQLTPDELEKIKIDLAINKYNI